MRHPVWIFAAATLSVVALGCSNPTAGSPASSKGTTPSSSGAEMRPPEDFASIEGKEARSRALFEEIGKVLLHPRCVNCHPAGDRPMQGDRSRPHQPLVTRGAGGFGNVGMQCTTCHGDENYRNVPGHPRWHLAPRSMAWEDKSPTEICRQLKDPERSHMNLEELVHHMAKDGLVGYGWNPPDHLEPVPGSQERFGALARAWADSGAHCPKPATSK